MANEYLSQSPSQNPDPQEKRVFVNDINTYQGQSHIPERPPKSLLDWLVRVHLRLMALEEEHKDTS